MTSGSTATELDSEASSPPRTALLTLDRVYLVAALGLACAAALCTVVRPHDFWWHIANGRTIVESGVLPTTDSFTYTRTGEPFFNQMWLSQSLMYLLYRAGGIPLVVAAHAAVITLAYSLLLFWCARTTRRPRLCALLLIAIVLPLSFSNWAVRPQPYAFPLFVVFLCVLLNFGESGASRFAWVLPLVMAAWVNVHGSFVLGLAMVTLVLGVQLAGRIAQQAWAPATADVRLVSFVAAATWLAVLINPRGFEVVGYVLELTSHPSVAAVSEWQPLAPTDIASVLYYLIATGAMMALVYGRTRPPLQHVALVVAFMLLGFTARRHTTWFALAVAPVLAMRLSDGWRPPRHEPGVRALNLAVLAIMGLVIVVASPWVRQAVAPPPLNTLVAETPFRAVDALAELPDRPQRIFNDLGYGSYLAWALPSQRSFIDPRFELFPAAQVADYASLSGGADLQRLAAKYRFDGFLVSKKYQAPLIDRLEQSPDWRREYVDDEAALFLPTSGS